jgi:hypothetical protein
MAECLAGPNPVDRIWLRVSGASMPRIDVVERLGRNLKHGV